MFFLKKLKSKRILKYNSKKVYLKKKLKKLFEYSFIKKKKKIYKKRYVNLKNIKNFYINYNLYIFFYKFFNLNKKKKTIFFINSFFFINIIKKKNNIFFNITNFKKDIIFSNSLKTLKILKKKRDMLKKNIISIFFLNSLKKFFKLFMFEKLFKLLPNIYILAEKQQNLLLKKLVRIFLRFIYFFINLFITSRSHRYKKYLYSVKKTIKFIRNKKKINILSLNLKYKNSFNGCRLKKLKRI